MTGSILSILSTLFTHWSFDPPIILGVVVTGALYALGTSATMSLVPRQHRLARRRRASLYFYSALALVVVALQSPLDYYSQSLMWAHMIQHLILIMLVAPLALLGDPALPMLRGVPIALRRRALGTVLGWRWVHGVGAALRWLSRPAPALAVFTITLWGWHWPAFYNLTLRNQGIHDLEHFSFLATGILFWWQEIDQTQFRCRLSYGKRAIYTFCSAVQNHLLSVTLAFAPVPLYAYSQLAHRPGGISALTDQQIAGGIMWVPGMIMYGTAFSICLYRWLRSQTLPVGASSLETVTPVPRQRGGLATSGTITPIDALKSE